MKRLKKEIFAFGILVLCIGLVACSGNKEQVKGDDEETEQTLEPSSEELTEFVSYEETLQVDDVFATVLEENGSTGFGWKFVIEDETILQLDTEGAIEEDEKTNKASEEIVGQSSQHEWKFKALTPGTTKITFEYSRSWEKELAAKVVEYTIIVEGEAVAFEAVSEAYPTDDQSISAQIILLEGNEQKTLRIRGGEQILADLPLDLEMATQILNVEWLHSNQILGITSHINPSLNQYTVVETEIGFKLSTYYGIAFTWNSDGSNLYYIQPAPHFSEETADSLFDKNGTLLYQTENGDRLSGTLIVTPDEKYIAFDIDTPEEMHVLLLCEKKDMKTITSQHSIADYYGIPAFKDSDTLILTTADGTVTEYKISDLENK